AERAGRLPRGRRDARRAQLRSLPAVRRAHVPRRRAHAENRPLADVRGGAMCPVAEVEALLDRLDALPDAAARETATATVQALLALYGEGLGRIVERIGPAQARALAADDELIAHLLLLHGLHPVPVE